MKNIIAVCFLLVVFSFMSPNIGLADLIFPAPISNGSGSSDPVIISQYNANYSTSTTAVSMMIAGGVEAIIVDNLDATNSVIFSLCTDLFCAEENTNVSTSLGSTIGQYSYVVIPPRERVIIDVSTNTAMAWVSVAGTPTINIAQGVYDD